MVSHKLNGKRHQDPPIVHFETMDGEPVFNVIQLDTWLSHFHKTKKEHDIIKNKISHMSNYFLHICQIRYDKNLPLTMDVPTKEEIRKLCEKLEE